MTNDHADELKRITAGRIKAMNTALFLLQDDLAPMLSARAQSKLDGIISDFMQEIYKLNENIKNCYWIA